MKFTYDELDVIYDALVQHIPHIAEGVAEYYRSYDDSYEAAHDTMKRLVLANNTLMKVQALMKDAEE